jgi:hypothetical protein
MILIPSYDHDVRQSSMIGITDRCRLSFQLKFAQIQPASTRAQVLHYGAYS